MPHTNIPMLIQTLTTFLLIFIHSHLLIHSSIIPPPPPFNLSHFIYPKVTAFTESTIPLQQPQFLQGVVDAIVNKEKWAYEDIRLSELDVKKVKYRSVQRCDFRFSVGKTEMLLKMYDEMSEWKKLRWNATSNFQTLAGEIGSPAVIDRFKIEGPFELWVTGGDDDQMSLLLPLNTSHTGLRRILVGEGITVEVKGAKEIFILQPSGHQPLYGVFTYKKWNDVQSIWPPVCTRLLPVRILGSASVVAYTDRRPNALIHTAFPSTDSIELLPERCYIRPNYEKLRHVRSSLSTRIALLDRVLKSLLNGKGGLGPIKVRIRALHVYRFQLELERDIRSNDTYWGTLAEWRMRPTTERVWFEVVARIEGQVLKPLVIKKVRPLIETDSFAWSSLSSNISFTNLPSLLVPPEALTLDVKW
ncbi:hypothetical protein ACS0TY_024263 [Phlomoides rotata]